MLVRGPIAENFAVTDVKGGGPSTITHKECGYGDRGGDMWEIAMSVSARGLSYWEDSICISTSDPKRPILTIPLRVHESDQIIATPMILIVSRNGKRSETVLRVTDQAVPLVGIAYISSPSWLAVQWQHEEAHSVRIEASVLSAVPEGTKGEIECIATDKRQIHIPVVVTQ